MILTVLQLGVRNLLLHKLRSFLTMLGTILGVGSVIAMLAIGEGSKRAAVEQIRQLGASNVIIRSVKPNHDNEPDDSSSSSQQRASRVLEYGLRYKDYDVLTSALTTVKRAVPIALVRRNAQHGRHRINNARILGTTPEYLKIKNLSLRRGRFIADADLSTTANVAVLAAGAAERLFGFEDPLGKSVLLGNSAYRVVGVLQTQGSGSAVAGAMAQLDMNSDIYIPLTAAQRRFGELQMIVRAGSREFERTQLSEITLTVENEELVSQTAAMARRLLSISHRDKKDFEIQVPLELLRQAEHEKRIWNLVLGSIAGISLLVGGVGVSNIMLVSVRERTREIGLRKALGARQRDVLSQFLIEAVLLTTIGGTIGIVIGVGGSLLIDALSPVPAAVTWWSIALAFGVSVAVGVFFGVAPARRASRLEPVVALRSE